MKLSSGIPHIEAYNQLLEDPLFKEMETYSNRFLQTHAEILSRGWRREPADPLHQWSRQWEYPYVFSRIAQRAGEDRTGLFHLLDAGSGITFFPFFLSNSFSELEMMCCDRSSSLAALYEPLNQKEGTSIRFQVEDIRDFSFEPESFHMATCISVLEHTGDYDGIIEEFHRLLKKGGTLLVTFDIGLDGSSRILPAKAEQLLELLRARFDEESGASKPIPEAIESPEILTARHAKESGNAALPWRYPLLSALKPFAHFRFPKTLRKNLTCYCGTFLKTE